MREGWKSIALGDVFVPTSDRLGSQEVEPRVFSISKHDGVVPADEYHGRRIASEKLDTYKCLPDEGWAYSTIHIDEGSIARNTNGFDGVVSPMYTTMKWSSETNDPAFFEMLLRSSDMLTRYADSAQGSINRRRSLPWSTFSTMCVEVPGPAEQQRIVDLIGSLDDAIEAANENAAHATNARFALSARSFALMSAGRTVPLSEIAETRLGKMLSANVNKGTPAKYVRNADVQWNSINLTGLKSMPFSDGDRDEYSIKRGDVLICEGGEIGRSSVVLDDLDNIYFQKAIHRVRCGETLIPEFLQAYMHHLAFSGGLENFSGGTTIPHLTGVNLRQLPMPVVPIADQRALVTILDVLNSNSSSLVAYAASLRHLRTNLLTALLSGTHEIPESYDDQLSEAA